MLLSACKLGYAEYLGLVISEFADDEGYGLRTVQSVQDRCRMTGLHHAAQSANVKTVEVILGGGEGSTTDWATKKKLLTALDVWKCNPLHRAVMGQDEEVARFLLQKSSPTTTGEDGTSEGPSLSSLLALDAVTRADVKDTLILAGDAPLHVAVRYGRPYLVELLVDAKADMNCCNKNGESPLDVAVLCAQEESGAVLVRKGATRALWKAKKMTWYEAVDSKLTFVAEYMRRTNDRKSTQAVNLIAKEHHIAAIHLACAQDYMRKSMADVVKILLDAKADANLRETQTGQTALHKVCGSMRKVRQREAFSRTSSTSEEVGGNNSGQQLSSPQERVILEAARALLIAGASTGTASTALIQMRDFEKRTAVMLAASSGSLELLQLLLPNPGPRTAEDQAAPRSPTASSKSGRPKSDVRRRNVLHYACMTDSVPIVEYLKSVHAEEVWNTQLLTATDEREQTPLLTAILCGCADLVRWFLESGGGTGASSGGDGRSAAKGSAGVEKAALALLKHADQKLQTPSMLACYKYPTADSFFSAGFFLGEESEGARRGMQIGEENKVAILRMLLPLYLNKSGERSRSSSSPPAMSLVEDEQEQGAALEEDGGSSGSPPSLLSLSARDWEGRQCVHIACQEGNGAALQLLISEGNCSTDTVMDWNCSPFMLACDRADFDCIQILLKQNQVQDTTATTSATTATTVTDSPKNKSPPLKMRNMLASRRSTDGCTPLLLLAKTTQVEDGADLRKIFEKVVGVAEGQEASEDAGEVNVLQQKCESSGRNVVHYLSLNQHVRRRKEAVLEFLLSLRLPGGGGHGGLLDVNEQDSAQWTALHYCCQRGDSGCVELLFAKGAVDVADDLGVTARSLAESNGHLHLLNLFP
eukprot:g10758.t1